jgi:hypothetical protein
VWCSIPSSSSLSFSFNAACRFHVLLPRHNRRLPYRIARDEYRLSMHVSLVDRWGGMGRCERAAARGPGRRCVIDHACMHALVDDSYGSIARPLAPFSVFAAVSSGHAHGGGPSYLSLALSIRCLSASSHDDIPITSTVRSATTDPAGAVRGGHRGRACICMMGLLVSRSIGLPFPTAAWAGHRAAGSTHHQPRRPAQKLACGRRREKKRLASIHFSLSRSLSRLSCLACSFSLPHSFDDLSLS